MAYRVRFGGSNPSEGGADFCGPCCPFWRDRTELIPEDPPIRIRQVRSPCAPPLVILHRIFKLIPLLNAARTDSNPEASCRIRGPMTAGSALSIRIWSQL